MKKILKGGTVISSEGSFQKDILIDGEIISKIGSSLYEDDAEVIDVSGCLLFPGFIDGHTHFDLEVAGTVTADNFESGTKAAIAGGTTLIVDFGTQYKGETLAQGLNNWHKKAQGKCSCDYGFHMSIADWKDSVKDEIPEMFDAGISTFKLYLTYDNMMIGDRAVYEVIKELTKYGGIAGVHCEHNEVIKSLQEEEYKKQDQGPYSHALSRPACLEAEAVSRLLRIAEVANAPVWIVHLTCKEALEEIRRARKRGQTVITETCPQYLLMDDTRLMDSDGDLYICAPPLRTPKDQEALWEALKAGEIQLISTDHCSFTSEQKKLGKDDFRKIPGGLPGVETRGSLIYTYGVKTGKISNEDMCRLLSENPAKLFGVYPKKGIIQEGSDADIVVLNPSKTSVITASSHQSKADYEPLEGTPLSCTIDKVFLRGTLVTEEGACIKEKTGQYIHRDKSLYNQLKPINKKIFST